ncbi:MAG: peptidase T [Bacteroidota bacterium]|nr:peptidase T [Bacteroidota bacterium]
MITFTCVDRFLKYVQYDTQSSEESTTYPSTEKQKILGTELVKELQEIGLKDAQMDEYGYVTATLEATSTKKVPVIGLIAHMDTSPDVTGENVKPVIHKNYPGGDIVLPADKSVVISVEDNPDLKNQIGNDIITADGTTLLGADDKAGIAEIFDAINHLIKHPEIKHGKIRICITPDEEVGTGTKYFDVKKFGADFAYTVDGELRGEIENETFCADSVTLTITGRNIHPGYAKNKLVNSIKVAAEIIEKLPKDSLSPETTEKREGYVHPHIINGGVEKTVIKYLIRDFEEKNLKEKEDYIRKLTEEVIVKYPNAKIDFKVDESYRNMRYVLDKYPHVLDYAKEAISRSGLDPVMNFIRGGTDGARLCFMGLPTPNLFAGGHSFHSQREWISVQDMQKAVETLVNLVQVWEEKSV